MKWNSAISTFVVIVGLCNPSYGFEWLDRLIGIDLDNSEAAPAYSQPMPAYRPYTAGYAPSAMGYQAPASNGWGTWAPAYGGVPQTNYRVVYQAVPVTIYQPVVTRDAYGNTVTTLRPVVSYRMQSQVVPNTATQPAYPPATSYAPAPGGYPTGN